MYFITARKRNLGQGNIFTSMCHSFCPQEGVCGVHGEEGACMAKGGHAWQKAGGACMGGGHVWQRGIRIRGHGWQLGVHGKGGHALQGGMCGRGVCVAGGMVARHACRRDGH